MKFPLLIFALLLSAWLTSCDYPEGGFYEIAAVDGSKVIGRWPFMIEELTDDTDLTVGFNILVPHPGELVTVPMKNGTDLSKRSWEIRIGQADSGQGDIQLELTHANDQLSFVGARRDPAAGQSEIFRGTDITDFTGKVEPEDEDGNKPGIIQFDGPLPTDLLSGKASTARWEIRRISQAQFEKALGTKVANATRRDAPYLAPLRQPKPDQKTTTVRPGKYKQDKPGGERKVGP